MNNPNEGLIRLKQWSTPLAARVDYEQRCAGCHHSRHEHHPRFGCMNWDERRQKGWCDCDGFRVRTSGQFPSTRPSL